MAGALSKVQGVSYQGNSVAQPLYLKTPHPIPFKPTRVTFTINWADYGAPTTSAIGINVNLALGNNQSQAIDSIRSVYIDNTFSDVPVYVFFPDSGFVAVAAPNSVTVQPVVTSAPLALIYSEGFTESVPVTTVIFMNAEINPYFIDTNFALPPVITYIGSATAADQLSGGAMIWKNIPLGPTALQRLTVLYANCASAFGWAAPITVSINGGAPQTPTVVPAQAGSSLFCCLHSFELPSVATLASFAVTIAIPGLTLPNTDLEVYSITRYQNATPINSGAVSRNGDAAQSLPLAMPRTAVSVFGSVGTAAATLVGTIIDRQAAFPVGGNWGVGHATTPIDETLTVTNTGAELVGAAWF